MRLLSFSKVIWTVLLIFKDILLKASYRNLKINKFEQQSFIGSGVIALAKSRNHYYRCNFVKTLYINFVTLILIKPNWFSDFRFC